MLESLIEWFCFFKKEMLNDSEASEEYIVIRSFSLQGH